MEKKKRRDQSIFSVKIKLHAQLSSYYGNGFWLILDQSIYFYVYRKGSIERERGLSGRVFFPEKQTGMRKGYLVRPFYSENHVIKSTKKVKSSFLIINPRKKRKGKRSKKEELGRRKKSSKKKLDD